jgi:hypothetical protein
LELMIDPRPWWTEADAAELDVLLEEFVRVAFIHRGHCAICSAGGPWCEPLREALDALLEWRRGRELRSKAEWLRARQEDRAA